MTGSVVVVGAGRVADLLRSKGYRRQQVVVLDSDEELPYTQLVLATGAVTRRLVVPGIDLAGVHELRTLADARKLRPKLVAARSVAVDGAGHGGVQVADLLRSKGYRRRVTLADPVLIGVEVRPRGDLAWAAGLAVDDGILVDEPLRAADPVGYAIGDCAAFPAGVGRAWLESVQNATAHGKHVAGLARPDDGAAVDVPVQCYRDGRLVAGKSLNRLADHLAARRALDHADLSSSQRSAR
ncbi:FAD-dependent oxidoreductase [Amycolatopsis jejuensis]|uniref:FAD-dependent oxidoreductase n=1 Tax=Amycolatopsis jejuensis TaxID=330084 RepID=UPI0005254ED4|nr:FAD-dependent oxidoreductase [Amycolatopsis jejuensis]